MAAPSASRHWSNCIWTVKNSDWGPCISPPGRTMTPESAAQRSRQRPDRARRRDHEHRVHQQRDPRLRYRVDASPAIISSVFVADGGSNMVFRGNKFWNCEIDGARHDELGRRQLHREQLVRRRKRRRRLPEAGFPRCTDGGHSREPGTTISVSTRFRLETGSRRVAGRGRRRLHNRRQPDRGDPFGFYGGQKCFAGGTTGPYTSTTSSRRASCGDSTNRGSTTLPVRERRSGRKHELPSCGWDLGLPTTSSPARSRTQTWLPTSTGRPGAHRGMQARTGASPTDPLSRSAGPQLRVGSHVSYLRAHSTVSALKRRRPAIGATIRTRVSPAMNQGS